jgi:hypothetical protein
MKYDYTGNKLIVDNNTTEFTEQISEIIDFGDFIVVRTDCSNSTTNENVFGINNKDQQIWQINQMETLIHRGKQYGGIIEPYSGLTKVDDNTVRLHNWDGTRFDIDSKTGELLTHPMDSRIGKRPW